MRPYVYGLVVQVQQGGEDVGDGGRVRAVAGQDEGVVAAPGREVVPREEADGGFYGLLFGAAACVWWW